MTTLATYGEDRLVAALLTRLPPGVRSGEGVLIGAGDDCAAVAYPEEADSLQLLKTDCVIEGIHYLADTKPERVGWKAMCRPISDLAAMGGKPLYALVTLVLPPERSVEYATGIYVGIGRAAERFGVRVVGGETARSPTVGFVSVALTGKVDRRCLKTRDGGQVGHAVYVTGFLGGSFASGKHLDFVPRLEEARWLVEHFPLSAMMDLSDGLGQDLPRLALASGTGYAVDPSRVPCALGCSVVEATSDGEDYELLFTLPPQACHALEEAWRERWPALALTKIGELMPSHECSGLDAKAGFDHFSSSR